MNAYFLTLGGLGFAAALLGVFAIAQAAMKIGDTHMATDTRSDALRELLDAGASLPGVAEVLDVYRQTAEARNKLDAHERLAAQQLPSMTVATGTSPTTALTRC